METSRAACLAIAFGITLCVLLGVVATQPLAVTAAGTSHANAATTTSPASANGSTPNGSNASHGNGSANNTTTRTWKDANRTGNVRTVSVTGRGVVNSSRRDVWLWTHQPVTLNVTYGQSNVSYYDACVRVNPSANASKGNATWSNCTVVPASANGTGTVRFPLHQWPINKTGNESLTVVLRDRFNSSHVLGRATVHPRVMRKSGDIDGDGLSNAKEVKLGTSFTNPDTDSDGLSDGAEVHSYHSNPLRADTNGDGLNDGLEVPLGINPSNRVTPVLFPLILLAIPVSAGVGLWRSGVRVPWKRLSGWRREESTAERSTTDGGGATMRRSESQEEPPVTDHDRVFHLLKDRGGRMYQADIVEETGWSKAKVSRLLSRMEDDGQITKINVGRENLITLHGDEPDWAR